MKLAKVLPKYKNKGRKLLRNNYSSIFVIPKFSKVYEKMLNRQLQTHLHQNNIILDMDHKKAKSHMMPLLSLQTITSHL
jgi:hypothetical protein